MNFKLFFLLYFFFIQFFLLIIKANNIKKIRLLHADYAIKDNNNIDFILKGNIILQHENYKIKCDNIKYYKKINKFIGKGDIKISYLNKNIQLYAKYIEYNINNNLYKVYGDPIVYFKKSKLTGNTIIYNDNIKLFQSYGDSSFINNKFKLLSDKIEYNIINFTVYYNTGGTIYTNNNIFFSEIGIYFFIDEKFFFKKIYLTNKKNTFFADSILYYSNINRIDFFGRTLIINNSNSQNFIFAIQGAYYINESITILKNNFHCIILLDNYIITGNNILFDNKHNNIYIKNNICIEDINKQQYFHGGYGAIRNKLFIITNNPIITNIFDHANLFISSDVLIYKKNNKKKSYFLYTYNSNTELENMNILSNYMIYNKKYIEYHNHPQIYFFNNKIIGQYIRLHIDKKENSHSIYITNNPVFYNRVYERGKLSFNNILGSMINIVLNQKNQKIVIKKKVRTLSYKFYKYLNNKKIFNNIDILNSDKLILYVTSLYTKIFFVGHVKSFSLKEEKQFNKKLFFMLNFLKPKKRINVSLQKYIIYMMIKKNIKKDIENLKKDVLL